MKNEETDLHITGQQIFQRFEIGKLYKLNNFPIFFFCLKKHEDSVYGVVEGIGIGLTSGAIQFEMLSWRLGQKCRSYLWEEIKNDKTK